MDDLAEAKVTANIPQNIWDPDNQVYLYDPNFSVDVNVTSADVPILELYSDASSVSSDIGGSLRVLDFDLIAKNTTANFSGKAYPGARLFIAKKVFGADVLLKQGVPVSENGDFKISGIPADSLAYSILAKDKEGRQSQVKVYNRPSLYESLDISGILLSPTIDLVRGIVTRGDFIKVVGSAYPQSRVQIQLDNDILYETKASGGGEYHILINTARLSFGQHSVSAKEQDLATRKESDFSPTRTFLVSALAVVKADLNNDGKITITDWSIFLENWRRSKLGDTKATTIIDLNENGKADISDFGIFLRAFKTQYFFFHH
ncbi:MAG: hypothetical protein HY983_01035 [Candidatus Magasanikbacteria bacterium]|nr:hypothetical protein [Candidatus Magasanikbacteria bacterium]